jgi:hypothetical protein
MFWSIVQKKDSLIFFLHKILFLEFYFILDIFNISENNIISFEAANNVVIVVVVDITFKKCYNKLYYYYGLL